MSTASLAGPALNPTLFANGQLPFSCRRVPQRVMPAPVRREAVDHYRRAVAHRRMCNRVGLGVAWTATVVIPAVVAILHG